MRFIHTADWQIGTSDKALNEIRIASLRNIPTEQIDFIVVAGDAFEHPDVPSNDLEAVASVMRSFPCPVYLIPGNHDPGNPGGIWDKTLWSTVPNLQVLREPKPLAIPGATLLPCPLLSRFRSDDPTAWMEGAPGEGLRIGIAHGNLSGIPGIGKSEPISEDIVEKARLDYLALGHWHGPKAKSNIAYSGTHETSSFGEKNSGHVLIVEPGHKPVPFRTGRLKWLTIERTIDNWKSLERELQMIATPADTNLRLILDGAVPIEDQAAIEAYKQAHPFWRLRIESDWLVPDLPFPPGLIDRVASRLQASTDPLSQRALLQLRLLAREAGL